MNSTTKNIIVFSFVVVVFATAIYVIVERDTRVVSVWDRSKYTIDSIYASPDERKSAQRFADIILPALKQKGLVITVEQSDMHTVITVSGKMWKERSLFFKKNFLTHVMIYNKVHGLPEPVTILDQHSGYVYAKVVPPGGKQFYE